MTTNTFDNLAVAAGAFLAEIAAKAHREQPAVYETLDAALKSGESCTIVTIRLLPGGIQIRATVNAISDGAEQLVLDVVDGVARPMQ
jgi:hypothetical protein